MVTVAVNFTLTVTLLQFLPLLQPVPSLQLLSLLQPVSLYFVAIIYIASEKRWNSTQCLRYFANRNGAINRHSCLVTEEFVAYNSQALLTTVTTKDTTWAQSYVVGHSERLRFMTSQPMSTNILATMMSFENAVTWQESVEYLNRFLVLSKTSNPN